MSEPKPDEMIKNLVRDYPLDALEFLKPEIIQKYGKPVEISFVIQEVKKHSHYDKNLKNDIAVCYTFGKNRRVVLVLIEHWSDKAKFDIHRFAQYTIDLSKRFPEAEILPVALFADRSEKWHKQPDAELKVGCFGKEYLSFRYQLVRLKDHQAEQYRKTKNRFIAVLRSAMRYETDKKLSLAVEYIQDYAYIEKDIRLIEKNLIIMEYFLEITEPEKEIIIEMMEERRDSNMIVQELKRRGYQEGMEQGIQQGVEQGVQKGIIQGMEKGILQGMEKGIKQGMQKGIQQGIREGMGKGIQQGKLEAKRETAMALLDENMSVEKISQITGLSVDEIENLKRGEKDS